MSEPNEQFLVVSFPKALFLSALSMAIFVVGCYFIGIPLHDPLLIGFLVFLVIIMTPVFALCVLFFSRTKISYEGLWPAVPTLYQRVLRWQDITAVQTTWLLSRSILHRPGTGLGRLLLVAAPVLSEAPGQSEEVD